MGQSRSPLGVAELERVAARGWRAPEEEALGGWLLRAAGGFTGRANTALVTGDPGLPLGEAADAVGAWYRARGLRPGVQLPGVASRPVDAALAAAGWERGEDVLVLTAPLVPGAADDVPVELAPAPDDAWLAAYREASPAARAVLTNAGRVVFAAVRPEPGGEPVAVARGVVTDDWLGVAALTVAGQHRRRGLATAVMGALTRWGAGQGAHWVYLQVAASNAPARALYRGAGYVEHHRYHYRWAPEDA
ncbi:Acetyltransferase (GNAT) family protein [Geodermatophilus saharensis]|uniref:Acetyltransferase (GNAT) family protein n=1 Tax=Geodermatophilus saharensis TaxID=1137994 RepID=A0A239F6M8_9ACTN|nr:GNAT family N-acetyltransferase [Geodermatophilus saharensis]SNS52700.1 Acetyltransferase (GNAT) family protein [Geodermatophilus saharensis]